jgi:RluA family pseudouridine synthase
MLSVVNIAAYKFAALTGLIELRNQLRSLCSQQQLRGTILLSSEGINMFVAGDRGGIDALLTRVREIDGLADIPVKESFSDHLPFTRMLVKIKKEIIAFGVDSIDPRQYTSKRLSAAELKSWLDQGKPVTLLDTRNDFEVQTGTFKNAVAIGVDDFRDFPKAVERLPQRLKSEPIVTFCTGGIRCEKAAPFLEQAGFENVYQLDGGILKYFEDCGGAHYQGTCFVFDQRVALDPQLKESNLRQCFACQAILTPEDQASPHYDPPRTCPHCYQSPQERYEKLLERRHAAIHAATHPLPGSVPYDNVRPISVPLRLDGLELLDFLDAMRTHLSREQWARACAEGRVVNRGQPVHPGRIVRASERFQHLLPATLEPDVATDIKILFEDDSIVVLNKPAPLPMHPCGRFNRNSLSFIMDQVYHPRHLRSAHRLDADTSGVVVFTKSREIAAIVQPQFEAGEVNKKYLARVHGHPAQANFECHARISPDPQNGGLRLPSETGDQASTHFKLIEKFDDGTSLLEVTPLTGRTNQIRVHAWILDHPIVGDPIYLQHKKLGGNQALSTQDPPMCLQACGIEFTHPTTKQRVRFAAPSPAWSAQ